MPNRLNKVQKQIHKKKGHTSALHQKSRDAQRLQRAAGRDLGLQLLAQVRESTVRPYKLRVEFFQTEVDDRAEPFTTDEVKDLVHKFLHRKDEEVQLLEAKRRPGRPPPKELERVKLAQGDEEREYTSGLWIPDLQDADNLFALRHWDGDWGSLNALKFVRVARGGVVRESRFPPNGQS